MCPKKKEKLDRDFYYKENAKFYSSSNWMAKNQIDSTERALELLEDPRIGGMLAEPINHLILLDLGCGNGFSSYVCEVQGFIVIGLDLSIDMLMENVHQQQTFNLGYERKAQNRVLINASIEKLPIRDRSIDHIISISAFNFVLDKSNSKREKIKILSKISDELFHILKQNGRIVIEFYPHKKDLDYYLINFKKNYTGGLVIDFPNLRKEKKFLILKSSN
jgi:SAM-dependent methyltransferase